MLTEFESELLKEVTDRRKIGKTGLPVSMIRDSQVKIRFTDSEREVVRHMSQDAHGSEAAFLYTLAISAVRDMMIADKDVAGKIKAELTAARIDIPTWMKEL